MKVLNKIIIIFISFSCLTLFAAWKFIHSEKFSREASVKVSKMLTDRLGVSLNFKGVEFSLFPLATTFKNVTISKEIEGKLSSNLKLTQLEISFTYSSFLSSELEVDKVTLREGEVNLKIAETDTPDIVLRDINIKKIFTKYNEIISGLPIKLNIVSLENVNLKVNEWEFLAKQITFSPQRFKGRLKLNVEKIFYHHGKPAYPEYLADEFSTMLSLDKDQINIEELKINKSANKVNFVGKLFNENRYLRIGGKGELDLKVEELTSEFKELDSELKEIKGSASGDFELSGLVDDPNGKISFRALNVDTRWVQLADVSAVVFKKNKKLGLLKLEAKNNNEEYQLLKPEEFFDLNIKKFTDFNFKLKVTNGFTNTFLLSAESSLKTLKGYLTGIVEVSLFPDKAIFQIKDKAVVNEFKLTSSNEKRNILINPGFELSNTSVVLNKDLSVNLDIKAEMKNSLLKAKGKITSENIDIKVTNSTIDLTKLGPIAGISLTGNGPFDLTISGPSDSVDFDFVVDWNNFSLLDLNFGKVKSKFKFNVNRLDLNIAELNGLFNKTEYSASGKLGFDGVNEGMDLGLKFSNANFFDTRKMLNLIFKNIKFPTYPDFEFESNITIKGGYAVDTLKVMGELNGREFKIGKEEAEKISMKLSLVKNLLSLKQIKLNKARGELNSNFSYNLKTNFLELSGAATGLRMRDFNYYKDLNLEYDGDLFVDFNGAGTLNDFSSRLKLRLTNAFIGNLPASSSNAVIYFGSNDLITNASLLAGKIKLDSLLNFKSGIAAIKCMVDTSDIRELFGVLSGHNITDKKLSGMIKAQLSTQVSTSDLAIRKFNLNIDQFNLSRGDIVFKIDPNYKNIEVNEGIVKNWDIRFKDNNEYFNSKGSNISNNVIAINSRFSLKASFLEVFNVQIEKASGVINGMASAVLDKKFSIKDFNLSGANHAFKIKSLPGFFTNFEYNIVKKLDSYEVQKMSGKYGDGEFKIGGRLVFDDLYPNLNLNYSVEKSTIPLFKKSSVLVSSNGTLVGNNLPYKLNGKVMFMYGEILDDPADILKDNKVSIDEFKKYLPENLYSSNKGLIDLNISFDTINPILIKNNLIEIYAKGNGQVSGDLSSPELNMKAEIVPALSKFKFKGHDFALSQGFVEIRDRGKNRISELKFNGTSKINDYDMKLDLSGSITNINIDLSSEPALSKEDLLSLLTLGVTSDISKNLESGERRFVTTVGIGSLLVDQLKINEDLNSSLGLKLSVQPEFKQDESTLIQGKSAISDGSSSRLKSATKIKLNKQVNKRVDVSLSSTIGGSLEQKQEMNINLNINKNFSVEGVYEVKPTEDENISNPNSLGADLKWRKSF